MIRTVIAALLAVALLAASQPAIDRARVGHASDRTEEELTVLQTNIQDLIASDDPVPPGVPGARRVVTVRLPRRSWASSGVERVAIGAGQRGGDRMTWDIGEGSTGSLRLPVEVRRPDGGPLVLRRSGSHQLALRLVRSEGKTAVVVRRLTFMPEGETTPVHDNDRRADPGMRVHPDRRWRTPGG